MKIVYQTNVKTGEYVGEVQADESPLEDDVWLIPAGAYEDEPPEAVEGKTIIRSDEDWVLVDDFRGLEVYEKATGQSKEWDKIGPISAEYTKKKPNTEADIWDGRKWITPEPEPVIPQSVSMAQGKRALIRNGLWLPVVALIESIEDETEKLLAESALHDPQEYRRDSPFLTQAADQLGLTNEQLDQLFIEASQDVI